MLRPIPHRTFGNRYIERVHWSLTGKCNFNCRHCFRSAPDGLLGEPPLEKCLDMVRQFSECGIDSVELTGGEPLIRGDFFRIVDELLSRNIHVGCVYTNGWLIDRAFLDEMKARGMKTAFQLSFDGVGYHDWMRRVPGAEERALDAMRLLREYGHRFSAAMCLCRENVGSVWETARLLEKEGCEGLKLQRAMPQGEWLDQPEHYLSDDELLEAYLSLAQRFVGAELRGPLQMEGVVYLQERDGKKTARLLFDNSGKDGIEDMPSCGILSKALFVGPNGAAVPCMSMCGAAVEKLFPNAFDAPLRDILEDSSLVELSRTTRRAVLDHDPECRVCQYRSLCCGGNCRASATGAAGTDFLARDRFVCYLFKSGWYDRLKKFAASCAE